MSSGELPSPLNNKLDCICFDSIEEDSEIPWFSLIQNLSSERIDDLKSSFGTEGTGLTRDKFINVLCSLYGNSNYALQSSLLFDQVNGNDENGRISWEQLLNFLLENLNRPLKNQVELRLHSIHAVPQTKRETVMKVVLLETDKYFCYAIVSKHGRVGVYDGHLNFLTSYQVIMSREDVNRSEEDRRRRNRWVTDALFCPDALFLVITNTARSIMIYEASGLKHVPLYLLLSTPEIVECLAYKPSVANGPSVLFMGDVHGEVTALKFLQPRNRLLRRKSNDKISLFYWTELRNEIDYVRKIKYGKMHGGKVEMLAYFAENDTILSCSRDPNASIVRKHALRKRRPFVFKFSRGATAFAASVKLKLIISGSDDGLLRVWNNVVNAKPIATLNVHKCRIVDVKIFEKQELFISLSADGVLKLWDLNEHICIQTVVISYPSIGQMGKIVEWGNGSIYPGPKRRESEPRVKKQAGNCFDIGDISEKSDLQEGLIKLEEENVWERSNILVTCCNYLADVKLQFSSEATEQKFLQSILPPPPLQNSVLIPSSWKIPSNNINTEQLCGSEAKINILVKEALEKFEFVLEKDFVTEKGGEPTDINYKVAILEEKKLKMREHVARGAPYLALDLFEIEELKLSKDLPILNRKKYKTFVEKIHRRLSEGSLKDQILSESSSPRSSRSSTVEFSLL